MMLLFKLYSKSMINSKSAASMKHKNVSRFWYTLFCTYKGKLFFGGFIKFLNDLVQFTGPMVLKCISFVLFCFLCMSTSNLFRLLLNFFTDPTKPKWLGICYAILLSIVVCCHTILLRAYYHCQFFVALRFRSAIIGLIYRKVCYSYRTAIIYSCFLFVSRV